MESLGYELLLLEQTHSDKDAVLRVYIDAPGGILLEDCEQVSRQISLILDLEDPIRGAYALEVSSPGADRPLVKPEHFTRVLNQEIRILTRNHILGRRRFKGRLIMVEDEQLVIEVDGEEYDIPLEGIETARLVPNFDD
ncbi:MAG: ribosome maturation factor RimP [Desulfobacterales bacterium]|nr:ribosome maturation factor RimP [Desulfobacterales bacterium]